MSYSQKQTQQSTAFRLFQISFSVGISFILFKMTLKSAILPLMLMTLGFSSAANFVSIILEEAS